MIRPLITGRSISGEALLGRERAHQYFVLQNGRVSIFWIVAAVALLLPAVLAAFGVVTAALVVLWSDFALARAYEFGLGNGAVRNLLVTMVGMAVATDIVVTLVALALASNAVVREHQNNTWDLLLLTGLSARRFVLGKWWASVLVLRRDFISVTILRAGLVSLLFLSPQSVLVRGDSGPVALLAAYLLALLLALVYSVLDAQFTAALGVLGGLSGRSTGVSLLLRLGALVLAGLALAVLVLASRGTPALGWLFLSVPAVLAGLWMVMLALSLWAALWTGVRVRILPMDEE